MNNYAKLLGFFSHVKYNYLYLIRGILVILVAVQIRQVYSQNVFIRTCTDPRIDFHVPNYTHTYCSHACRPGMEADSSCLPNGLCLCSPPCNADGSITPAVMATNDICPQASDPPDSDPNFEATCRANCLNQCPGGIGVVCGEIQPFFPGNIYAKICTCSCPAISCTPPTTTTMSSILIPLKKLKKYGWLKKKVFWILKKLMIGCIFIFKILFVKFCYLILFSAYLFMVNGIFDYSLDLRYFESLFGEPTFN